MRDITPVNKYDFANGGEVDISANYVPQAYFGEFEQEARYKGRLSLRRDGREYQLYVHYHQLRGPSGAPMDEILLSSKSLAEVCDRATKLNEEIMRRMFKSSLRENEIPEFVAVPDDVADDVYRKNNSALAVNQYWRRHGAI
jgi:hypothetical protein